LNDQQFFDYYQIFTSAFEVGYRTIRTRAVATLFHWNNFTVEEISKVLFIPVKRVQEILFH
jgi:hypothetical protein